MYANSIPANEGAGDLIYGGRRKKKASAWNMHVKRYAKAHPNVPFEDIAYKARASYKGSGTTAGGRRRSVKRRSTSMKRRPSRKRAGFFGPLLGAIASVGLPHLAKAIGLGSRAGSRAGAFVGGSKQLNDLKKYNREIKALNLLKQGVDEVYPVSIPTPVDPADHKDSRSLAQAYKDEFQIMRGQIEEKKLRKARRNQEERKKKIEQKYYTKRAQLEKKLGLIGAVRDARKTKKTDAEALEDELASMYDANNTKARKLALENVGLGYSSFYDGLLGTGGGRRRKRTVKRRRTRKPSMGSLEKLLGMGLLGGRSRKKKRSRY
jgi:hypothetical protein